MIACTIGSMEKERPGQLLHGWEFEQLWHSTFGSEHAISGQRLITDEEAVQSSRTAAARELSSSRIDARNATQDSAERTQLLI